MDASDAGPAWDEAIEIGAAEMEAAEFGAVVTGDAGVDAAHRRLCALYTAVRESLESPTAGGAPAADLDALCGELLALTRDHFADEERLMAAHAFPELAIHRRQHATFLERMAEVRAFVLAGDGQDPAGGDEAGDYVRRYLLLAAIGQWLKVHTAVADRRFADYLALVAPRGGVPGVTPPSSGAAPWGRTG